MPTSSAATGNDCGGAVTDVRSAETSSGLPVAAVWPLPPLPTPLPLVAVASVARGRRAGHSPVAARESAERAQVCRRQRPTAPLFMNAVVTRDAPHETKHVRQASQLEVPVDVIRAVCQFHSTIIIFVPKDSGLSHMSRRSIGGRLHGRPRRARVLLQPAPYRVASLVRSSHEQEWLSKGLWKLADCVLSATVSMLTRSVLSWISRIRVML